MSRKILNAWGKFKYKQVLMEPYRNLLILTGSAFFAPLVWVMIFKFNVVFNHFCLFSFTVLLCIAVRELMIFFRVINTTPINNFIVITKHPVKSNKYYIYQKVDRNALSKYYCQDLRELYFSEMPQVLCFLKPGTYRMVTQPLFTRELLKAKNVQVICKEKAYKKKTGKLQEEIFLNRCRTCSKTDCLYRASKAEKQFYYVEFKVLEGCVTSNDEPNDGKYSRKSPRKSAS